MEKDDVTKILEGDLSPEDIEKLDKELTPEQKEEVTKKVNADFKGTLQSLSAIRKEKNRVEEKARELDEKAKDTEETLKNFRNEQVEKAKAKFIAEFGEEEYAKIEDTFKRVDSGKTDADLIFKDMKGAYAYQNSDTLIEAKKSQAEMEKNADNANGSEAGGSSAKPSDDAPEKKYSDEAVELSKKAGISEEQAEKQVKEGMSRKLM